MLTKTTNYKIMKSLSARCLNLHGPRLKLMRKQLIP